MLSIMEVIIALKRIPLFSGVHGEGLKRISDAVWEKKLKAGELVFAESDFGEEMYLVYSGKIVIFQDMAGKVEPLEVVEPGGYFGEMAIIDELPRSKSARAMEDSTLLVLHKNDFRTAVYDYPDIAFAVFKDFSRRLRRVDERIRSLAEELARKGI